MIKDKHIFIDLICHLQGFVLSFRGMNMIYCCNIIFKKNKG